MLYLTLLSIYFVLSIHYFVPHIALAVFSKFSVLIFSDSYSDYINI